MAIFRILQDMLTSTLLIVQIIIPRHAIAIEDIKAAQNTINELLINEMYASLNDFYDSIGLGRTKLGKELGWNIDSGTLQIDFDSALSNEESEQQGIHKDTPCLVLDYNLGPKYNFDKMCY